MSTDPALLRLLQLVSPGLPIGMYSYSQGMEKAVDDGLVTCPNTARAWLSAVLARSQACVDLPVMARLYAAWQRDDFAAVETWSAVLMSCRETAELRAEDRQTGLALHRLLTSLHLYRSDYTLPAADITLAALFSHAAVAMGIALRDALLGYCWSWLENQVLCAVKLVPLGQVAGQRLLLDLAENIPNAVSAALVLSDDDIGGGVFGVSLASSRHEMQYSRLFRS